MISLKPNLIKRDSEGKFDQCAFEALTSSCRYKIGQTGEGLGLPTELGFKGHSVPHLLSEWAIKKTDGRGTPQQSKSYSMMSF